MPPRRRRNDNEFVDVDITELVDVVIPTNRPVSTQLSKDYYRLKKIANEPLDPCSICLESVDCPRCFTLLPCGHYLCGSCYIRIIGEKKCPLCRST